MPALHTREAADFPMAPRPAPITAEDPAMPTLLGRASIVAFAILLCLLQGAWTIALAICVLLVLNIL